MRVRKKIRTLLFITVLCFYAKAQKSDLSIDFDTSFALDFQDVMVQHRTTSNGLLQNSIMDIAMDSNHLIWLASERGVSSYDGSGFIHFSGQKYLGKVFGFDNKGRLIGAKYFIENGLAHHRDIRDSLYIGRYGEVEKRSELPDFNSESLVKTNSKNDSGFYWLNHTSAYFIKDGVKISLIDSAFSREVYFIKKRKLYYLNKHLGLYVFQNEKLKSRFHHSSFEHFERWIWCHKSRAFYYLSRGNLYRLSIESGKPLVLELILKGIPIKAVVAVMVDKPNNRIYLGTSNNGLFILQKKQFQSRFNPDFGKWNNTYSQVEIGQDSILTATGLLYTPKSIQKVLPYNHIKGVTILKDSSAKIYLTSGANLDNVSQDIRSKIQLLPKKGGLNAACYGPEGSIIVKYTNEGTVSTAEGEVIAQDSSLEEKVLNYYNPFNEELWLTAREYIWIYNLESRSLRLVETDPEQWRTRTFYAFNKDITLAAFQDVGLKAYYKEKWIDLPLDGEKHLNYAHCMIEDSEGYIWISTNNGLFKLSGAELEAFVKGSCEHIYYYWFGEDEGIQNIELNGFCEPCALKLNSGKFSVPSLNGLLLFDPLEVKTAPSYPDIIIRNVRLDGRDTVFKEGQYLSQDLNKLEFQVSAPFYGHPFNNRMVQYQLKGLSNEWYSIPESGVISFSKLSHGHYDLLIRRKLGFGVDNFSYSRFSFNVKPYYYQTPWFIILVLFLAAFSIWLAFFIKNRISKRVRLLMEAEIDEKTHAYRLLNEQLKLNNAQLTASELDLKKAVKMREKLIELYAHQIRGPLKFMGDAAERNKDHIEDMSPKELKKWFTAIADTSSNIYGQTERLFGTILSDKRELPLNRNQIRLKGFVAKLLLNFEREIREADLNSEMDVPDSLVCYEDYNMLVIVLNNLITNALQNTKKGEITIEGYEFTNNAVIIVKDTGKGMPPEMVKALNDGTYRPEKGKGLGLKICKMLLDEMEAYIQVESKKRYRNVHFHISDAIQRKNSDGELICIILPVRKFFLTH